MKTETTVIAAAAMMNKVAEEIKAAAGTVHYAHGIGFLICIGAKLL